MAIDAKYLDNAIKQVLEKSIGEATEAVVKSAVAEFESRLRKAIATSALDVSRFFDVVQSRDNIVITIKDVRK